MRIISLYRLELLFLLALTIILSWMYGDYLFTNTLLGDISPFHHEFSEKTWFFKNLQSGSFTWLDPRNDLGHPLLANPTNGLVYIWNIFYFLDSVIAYKLIFVFHFFVLAFGAHQFTNLFLEDSIQKKSLTVMLMSCGLIWSLPIHVAIAPIAYFPWLIISMIHFSKTASLKNALLAGTLSGFVFVLGDPFLIPAAALATLPTLKINKKFISYVPLYLLSFFLIAAPNFYEMIQVWSVNARNAGFVDWEALSYSTNPWRLLEVLFPWKSFQSDLGIGFHRQWWFPRIGVGIVLSSLILWGGWKSRLNKQIICFMLLSLFFLQLAFGQFSPVSTWIMNRVFWFIRFPERFLAYSFILLIPVAAVGINALKTSKLKKYLPLLFIFSLTENLLPKPSVNTIPSSQLNSLVDSKLASQWIDNSQHPSRVFGCNFGADGALTTPIYFDLRGQGISMANAESNTFSEVLKNTTCPWVLSSEIRSWLGITHFLTPPTNTVSREYMINLGLKPVEKSSAGELWNSPLSSPLVGTWIQDWVKGSFPTSNFKKPFKGTYSIDLLGTDQEVPKTICDVTQKRIHSLMNNNRLVVSDLKECSGILSLPWSYHANWSIADYKGQRTPAIIRINQATLGILVPAGTEEVTLNYQDGPRSFFFLLSILTQLIFFFWLIRENFPSHYSEGKKVKMP